MKRYQLWIAIAVLILPILARTLWFYHGISIRPPVQTPDYESFAIPRPPVSTPQPEKVTAAAGKIMVLDYIHGNQFEPSELETLTIALTSRGARVEFDDGNLSLSTRLKYASAYVVISPTYAFTTEEIVQVQRFVSRGGRLLVFTDPTRGLAGWDWYTGNMYMTPDVNAANALLAPFDITFTNDYLYNLIENEGNYRHVQYWQFGKNALAKGLTQVVFYSAHSVNTDTGTALILGDENTLSSRTDSGGDPATGSGLAAAAISEDENVLAIGDFTFLMPPYNQVADNGLLLSRIADFLLGGARTHELADFPFVFDRPVYLLPTGEIQLNTDLLSPVAYLQSALQTTNTPLYISQDPLAKGDRLILGLLTPSEDLKPFLEPFNLGLDDSSTITIPGFGKVNRSGIGLMLYQTSKTGNTLILLTEYPEDLPTLINLLASGDLSSCVIQENIGVCSVVYGGGYYGYEEPYTEEPAPTKEPAPVAP